MVYLGRPSRGCQACKTRRIKCDETHPACQNCIKTNRECPGLPTEADLIFRNVSPGARRKTKSRSRKGSHDREGGESQSISPEIEEQQAQLNQSSTWTNDGQTVPIGVPATQVTSGPSYVRSSPSPEKQASTSTHEMSTSPTQNEATSQDFLEALRPLLALSPEGSPLKLATQAVSLATMAKQPTHQHLVSQAQNAYTTALHALQQDLQNPALALSDPTLLAVLTFALYEITTPSEQSSSAWAKHIDGAITLLKSRSLENLADERSQRMFRAIREQILMAAGPRSRVYFENIGDVIYGDEQAREGDESAMRMRRILAEYQEFLQRGAYGF
ncbi:hypothetical protein DOTSEDRAFT_73476 [Dothistroma septosporum NZE10]|uniref:Zn(2)-C6 fungal-type domain-containing protein n=1 Tax=Dothistroma septosporum (strain NZE10 / CBS 128990) TaxID=675120 RepID=N1PJA5_DOTSN|nr:hypothetical protein DOTSEDRAFT_73476 [Dothistroma septosporum NZE10]